MDAELLNFTLAVIGQLAETGEARPGYLKIYPENNDLTDAPRWHKVEDDEDWIEGQMAIEKKLALLESGFPMRIPPSPRWRDCPSAQKDQILSKPYPPLLMAIAVAEIGKMVIKQKPGGRLEVAEFYKANPHLIGKRAGNKSSATTAYNYALTTGRQSDEYGRTRFRESSQQTRLPLIFRELGISVSRRMICHYRKKKAELEDCKDWLRREVIRRRISAIPAAKGEVIIRDDVNFRAGRELEAEMANNLSRSKELKRLKIRKIEKQANGISKEWEPVKMKEEVALLYGRARKIQESEEWKTDQHQTDSFPVTRGKEVKGLVGSVMGCIKPPKKRSKTKRKPTPKAAELGLAVCGGDGGERRYEPITFDDHESLDSPEDIEADRNNPYLRKYGVT